MSMMDFAGALGGGAPPAGGAPPDVGDTTQDQGSDQQYSTSLDALDAAVDAVQAFIQLDHDAGDRAVASECLQNLLKLQASNQQDTQQGGMKSLTRAIAAGAGGGPGG